MWRCKWSLNISNSNLPFIIHCHFGCELAPQHVNSTVSGFFFSKKNIFTWSNYACDFLHLNYILITLLQIYPPIPIFTEVVKLYMHHKVTGDSIVKKYLKCWQIYVPCELNYFACGHTLSCMCVCVCVCVCGWGGSGRSIPTSNTPKMALYVII